MQKVNSNGDIERTASKRHSLPRNHPIMFRPPPILIHKESKLIIAQQKQAIEPVYRNRFSCSSAFFSSHKVQRGIRWIEQGLRFEVLEIDDFEAFGAADAEFGF